MINAPEHIKKELEPYGLTVCISEGVDIEAPKVVGVKIPLKGNGKLIKELEAKGWYKGWGTVCSGKRYIELRRDTGTL